MNNNLNILVEEILKEDEIFAVQVCEANDVKEVQAIFAEKEIELSEEEAQELMKQLQRLEQEEEALAEEDLEEVAGGYVGFVIVTVTAIVLFKMYQYYRIKHGRK